MASETCKRITHSFSTIPVSPPRWPVHKSLTSRVKEICGTINAFDDDAGTPLFTKAAFRDLARIIAESSIRPVQAKVVSLHFPITII
ncbi:predicted protein [Chaetomium globosum CBS 148.51]|uniref:Uncharacterized protein n=1 Tax=Chaetomium globosum (strain ATCC 6205 / CBS 148.51 / DSM 1962 / NBRC 6347 / NRRL 1970) TaxID=306901 RepID=Q2HCS7_CHAGB|nr:uncharacterized protein CHGG_01977 [Chaetomium globosum CBS 148.51]EAQ93742.1 predicted protein [Chaetomium globosum CBS 148.51]